MGFEITAIMHEELFNVEPLFAIYPYSIRDDEEDEDDLLDGEEDEEDDGVATGSISEVEVDDNEWDELLEMDEEEEEEDEE